MRFALLLAAIFVGISSLTFILHRIFRKYKQIKYVPAAILLVLSVYYYYLSTTPYTGFEDIARIIMVVMLFTGFISGLVTGILLDFILPRMKRR